MCTLPCTLQNCLPRNYMYLVVMRCALCLSSISWCTCPHCWNIVSSNYIWFYVCRCLKVPEIWVSLHSPSSLLLCARCPTRSWADLLALSPPSVAVQQTTWPANLHWKCGLWSACWVLLCSMCIVRHLYNLAIIAMFSFSVISVVSNRICLHVRQALGTAQFNIFISHFATGLELVWDQVTDHFLEVRRSIIRKLMNVRPLQLFKFQPTCMRLLSPLWVKSEVL